MRPLVTILYVLSATGTAALALRGLGLISVSWFVALLPWLAMVLLAASSMVFGALTSQPAPSRDRNHVDR